MIQSNLRVLFFEDESSPPHDVMVAARVIWITKDATKWLYIAKDTPIQVLRPVGHFSGCF
jgi:hypothetical protein